MELELETVEDDALEDILVIWGMMECAEEEGEGMEGSG